MMGGYLLTTESTVTCTHGAPATLITTDQRVSAGARVLLESDVHTVSGCPFTTNSGSSPCVRIVWSRGANRVTVDGTAPLLQSSVGQCKNAAGVVQGTAIVAATQGRASAQ